MSLMHRLLPFILLSALAAPACDPAADSCEAPAPVDGEAPGSIQLAPPAELDLAADSIAFREQGPPMGLIITQITGAPIKRAGFVSMIQACKKQADPPLTCSISWYQPDTSKQERVLGVGCSMMAGQSLWQCYVDYMTANNAVAY